MSDNGEENPTVARSVLIVEFAAKGSAEFSIHTENVTPAQLLAAAAWLDWFARKNFDAVGAQQTPGILVPRMALKH